jgi:hypothetical protein
MNNPFRIAVILFLFWNLTCLSFAKNKTEGLTFYGSDDQTETIHKLDRAIHNNKMAKIIRKYVGDDLAYISVVDISPDIQSVAICTQYTGGASGNTYFETLTFDVKTGKIYQLPNLFKTGTDLAQVIWPYVKSDIVAWRKKHRGHHPDDEGDVDDLERGPEGYKSFSLDSENLYLYFDQCDLFPCVVGPHVTTIPLIGISSHLRQAFIPEKGESSN